MSQYGQNGIEHLDYGTLSRTLTKCLLSSNVETKAGRRLYGKSNGALRENHIIRLAHHGCLSEVFLSIYQCQNRPVYSGINGTHPHMCVYITTTRAPDP